MPPPPPPKSTITTTTPTTTTATTTPSTTTTTNTTTTLPPFPIPPAVSIPPLFPLRPAGLRAENVYPHLLRGGAASGDGRATIGAGASVGVVLVGDAGGSREMRGAVGGVGGGAGDGVAPGPDVGGVMESGSGSAWVFGRVRCPGAALAAVSGPVVGVGMEAAPRASESGCKGIDQISAGLKASAMDKIQPLPEGSEKEGVSPGLLIKGRAAQVQNLALSNSGGQKVNSGKSSTSVKRKKSKQDNSQLLRDEGNQDARKKRKLQIEVDWERHHLKKKISDLRLELLKPNISIVCKSQLESKIKWLCTYREEKLKSPGKQTPAAKRHFKFSPLDLSMIQKRAIIEAEILEREAERQARIEILAANATNVSQAEHGEESLTQRDNAAPHGPWNVWVRQPKVPKICENREGPKHSQNKDDPGPGYKDVAKNQPNESPALLEQHQEDAEMPARPLSIDELSLSSPCKGCKEGGHHGHTTSNFCRDCLEWGHSTEKCPVDAVEFETNILAEPSLC